MMNTLSFHQSLVIGLNWLSFGIIPFKLCNIVILQKTIANQRMTLKHDKRKFPNFTNNIVNCMNAFNKNLGEWKFCHASSPFVAHNCGYNTPKVFIT
jgi:hypothetical protein